MVTEHPGKVFLFPPFQQQKSQITYYSLYSVYCKVNTYHTGIGFTAQKCSCFLTFLKNLMAISQINEPIPGMFVLI